MMSQCHFSLHALQVKKQACYLRRQGAPTFQAIPSGELREGDTLALSSAFGDTGFQLVREAGAQPGNCPVHRSVDDRAGVPGQLEPVPQLQGLSAFITSVNWLYFLLNVMVFTSFVCPRLCRIPRFAQGPLRR